MISENEWRVWTRGDNGPREFGLTRRVVVGYDGVKEKWTGTDEYAAVFSSEQIKSGTFDTILMDIDAHNGEDWTIKAKDVLSRCTIPPTRVYVTGRGAHFYWDLDEPVKGAGRYKQVVSALVKIWGIKELVDAHVVGDVRRVARLPMSVNSKNGGWAVRVPKEILDASDIRVSASIETLVTEAPGKITLIVGETEEAQKTFPPQLNGGAQHIFKESEYPPCIRIAIKQMMDTGELDHMQRLHLFSFLVQNDEMQKGWELLKNYAGDFNPSISEYQLNNLAQKEHRPYKCGNVPKDLCPYAQQRECVYYPSINVWRQKRIEACRNQITEK